MNADAAALARITAEAASVARTNRPVHIETKALQDFVTDMDHRLEEQIRGHLQTEFPGIPVLGEESVRDDEHLPGVAFIVDPLDGTGNWIAGIRIAAVSVALIRDGKTELAAVTDIYNGTSYAALAGKGAWRDSSLLTPPAEPNGLICLSTGLLDRADGDGTFRALRKFGKLRNLGAQSLQLCAVAEGALALSASFEARLWDDAAGRLIAEEAGARYESFAAAEDKNRPAAQQRSLCAHSAVWGECLGILAPALSH